MPAYITFLKRYTPQDASRASGLYSAADILSKKQQYMQAVQYLKLYVELAETLPNPDPFRLSRACRRMGEAYFLTGDYTQAEQHLLRATRQRLIEDQKNASEMASAYNSLGQTYTKMGNFAEAETTFYSALHLLQAFPVTEVKERSFILDSLFMLYMVIEDRQKALRVATESLQWRERYTDADDKELYTSYNNLAVVYMELGNTQEAERYYLKALEGVRRLYGEHHEIVAHTYNNLMLLYQYSDPEKALGYGQAAATVYRALYGDESPQLGRLLHNVASILERTPDKPLADGLLRQSLLLKLTSDDLLALQNSYAALSAKFTVQGDFETATFFGKLVINEIQQVRGSAARKSALQDTFYQNRMDSYRSLIRLLTERGRLVEAQQVLTMLKQEELYDFMTRAPAHDPRTMRVDFIGPEKQAFTDWQKGVAIVRRVYQDRLALQERQNAPNFSEKDATLLRGLTEIYPALQKNVINLLDSLPERLAPLNPHNSSLAATAQLPLLQHLRPALADMEKGVALVHTIMGENSLTLLLTTAENQLPRIKTVTVSYAELSRQIRDFRQMLVDGEQDPRPAAQALYSMIIRPLEAELSAGGTTTLLLSLDGPLRYLPPAALHDGQRWLVEKYALALFTEAYDAARPAAGAQPWSVAAMGLTREYAGFAALPYVGAELSAIVRTPENEQGVVPGAVYLNQDFTEANFEKALRTAVPVVHLATHFQFEPGTVNASFLLLGDGTRLSLQRLLENRFSFTNVDMLTLSACNTAMLTRASGSEVEGLGALAQRKGARSVLATLWPVADASTSRLMADFYRIKHVEGRGKAEALRQAQLRCIRSGGASASPLRGRIVRPNVVNTQPTAINADFGHPYFWAPFILMGDWR